MPELDKWQQRQAQQHAADNDVTYDEAVAELFPGDVVAEAAEDEQAKKPPRPAKVDTSKATA